MGFASGIGRLGAILGPILIGALVSLELSFEQNFLAISIAGVIGALAVLLVDQRLSATNVEAPSAVPGERLNAD